MHSGDWNDVMNYVGTKGRGESVWLSMALHLALRQFEELAREHRRHTDAEMAAGRAEVLALAIEKHGWDGGWYRRAYTDEGLPVGSAECDEAQCFLNPQTWAVVSGVADHDRSLQVLKAVDDRLEIDIGVKAIDTPFTRFRPDIGFLSAIRPGENVNAGVYLHANVFKIVADCMMKRNEAAWRTTRRILPFSEARGEQTGEPFVIPNAYFGPGSDYRYGEAGSGWITGTAGWLITAVAGHLFGVRPGPDGLRIDPCLPAQWKHCAIRRTYRGAAYHIVYDQAGNGPCNTVERILVDGEVLDGDTLPYEDGRQYEVLVRLTGPNSP
jgi:cellobiose phosphorylase